jgi:hypothetical protein
MEFEVEIINQELIFNVFLNESQNDVVEIDLLTENHVINVEVVESGNGKSAYDLAVQDGFVGPLDEWLESLKGQDGKDKYQSYLETTTDDPPLSEGEWSASFKLVDTFNNLNEATSLETADKLMISRVVGGVPTLYKVNKDALFNESILFSVRKIGEGSNNRAFRLRRSSDNNQQDIYFDVNGEISDNSLCENEQTFGVWRGADTLYLIIWYNQSQNGGDYDLIYATGNNPIFNIVNKNLLFYNSICVIKKQFYLSNKYTNFNVQKIVKISGGVFTTTETISGQNRNYYMDTDTYRYYMPGAGNQYTGNIPLNQTLLHSEKIIVGGYNDDNMQNVELKINGNNMAVNINRDYSNANVLQQIRGGNGGLSEMYRSEIRWYNHFPTNYDQIVDDIKNYFNL